MTSLSKISSSTPEKAENLFNPSVPVLEINPEILPHLQIINTISQEELAKQQTTPRTPRALTDRALESLPTTPIKKESASPLSLGSEESADASPEKTPARKSKFFAGSDSPSENTPETTPQKKVTASPLAPQTPTDLQVAKKIIRTNDPNFNLMPKDKQSLEKGLRCLDELTSPQHGLQVQAVQSLVSRALAKEKPILEMRSPLAPRRLLVAMNDCPNESWISSALKPSGIHLLDRTHHTHFVQGSGKHICPMGDPLDGRILKRRINLETGIWCGMITTANQEEKFSSFIPRSMTEEQYYALIQKTLTNNNFCIARAENKGLYTVHGEGFHFCIEVYSREAGAVIKSAFPIFHHEMYNGKKKTLEIEIGHKWSIEEKDPWVTLNYELSYKVILDHAKALKKGAEAIQYETDSTLIVDVNLLVGSNPNYTCPIQRGILVSIPKKSIQ